MFHLCEFEHKMLICVFITFWETRGPQQDSKRRGKWEIRFSHLKIQLKKLINCPVDHEPRNCLSFRKFICLWLKPITFTFAVLSFIHLISPPHSCPSICPEHSPFLSLLIHLSHSFALLIFLPFVLSLSCQGDEGKLAVGGSSSIFNPN